MLRTSGARRLWTSLWGAPAFSCTGQQLSNFYLENFGGVSVSYGLSSLTRNFFVSPSDNSCALPRRTFTAHKWGFSHLGFVHFSTEANQETTPRPESTQELYTKLLESVKAKTMPPNALLWLLIEKCSNMDDIELLFQILHRLRVFRLSNLRIHENYNSHLCLKVAEACIRCGALEYGMKTLWKHNVYGLTPAISCAHRLLLHAKDHSDVNLMERVLDVLKKNFLALQPGTADIVFSICYNTNNWKLLSKYAKRFLEAGVKLRRNAYDNLMEFASKMGDANSIWKTEQCRSKHLKLHTFITGFACAKAHLIERNPESAAAVILNFYKELPEAKKPFVSEEVQKLVSEWPTELLKRKKGIDVEGLINTLRSDIPVMVSVLLNLGVVATVNLDDLKC